MTGRTPAARAARELPEYVVITVTPPDSTLLTLMIDEGPMQQRGPHWITRIVRAHEPAHLAQRAARSRHHRDGELRDGVPVLPVVGAVLRDEAGSVRVHPHPHNPGQRD